jgi:TPR repeat protein
MKSILIITNTFLVFCCVLSANSFNKDGKKDGKWTHIDENQGLIHTETYVNGILHGPWFLEDEDLIIRVNYRNGKKEGVGKSIIKKDKETVITFFHSDNILFDLYYDFSGNLLEQKIYTKNDDSYIEVSFFDNLAIEEVSYNNVDGIDDRYFFYKNQSIKEKRIYKDDEISSEIEYYKSGNVRKKTNYTDGDLESWVRYSVNGNVQDEFKKNSLILSMPTEAREKLISAAKSGNVVAQLKLGHLYYQGFDGKEALRWFRQAAEQGAAEAQYNLGVMYRDGLGVPQNIEKAIKLFEQAAKQGYAKAKCSLGVMYRDGQGMPKNDKEAMKLFEQAAKQGLAEAQYNLGLMYEEGQGVPQNKKEALKWFELAAEQGYAHLLGFNNELAGPENYKEAMRWYRVGAENGDKNSQWGLAFMYYRGKGVLKNYFKAYVWLLVAEASGTDIKEKEKDFQSHLSETEIVKAQELAIEKFGEIKANKNN